MRKAWVLSLWPFFCVLWEITYGDANLVFGFYAEVLNKANKSHDSPKQAGEEHVRCSSSECNVCVLFGLKSSSKCLACALEDMCMISERLDISG
jgi:hypothetical protein